MTDKVDTLFSHRKPIESFRFDKSVVDVFPDMINRSVPGYATTIATIGLLSQKYAQEDSHIFDLGCSLGAASLAMRQNIVKQRCKIIAIDNSQAMIDQCKPIIERDNHAIPVELHCADIRHFKIENASIVVLNFTLQFLPEKDRDAIIENIYQGLKPKGILIISEKVSFPDTHYNQLQIDLHHEFKRINGYSDLEISHKRNALDNVLIPETLDRHKSRLNDVGFHYCDVWYQCFNFISMLAIK